MTFKLPRAEVDIVIPFHDVDMMSVAWHGHYAKYFEIARCVLFDKIDYNYQQMSDSGYAWPVIDMHIRYPKPVVFNQKVIVSAQIIEWENRLKIQYEMRDSATGERTTRGFTTQVAVQIDNGEMCFESPPILQQKLAQSC